MNPKLGRRTRLDGFMFFLWVYCLVFILILIHMKLLILNHKQVQTGCISTVCFSYVFFLFVFFIGCFTFFSIYKYIS